ncbi:MAG: hypothetical protein ACMUIG_06570 [Thermoplasmatota archaeon]
MSGLFPGLFKGRTYHRRCFFITIILIVLMVVFTLPVSNPAGGVDLPAELEVELENSGNDDGDLGYVGSTFDFTVDRPGNIQHDQVDIEISIDGISEKMEWDGGENHWSYRYTSTAKGIFTWEVVLTDLTNESNYIKESGQIAVLEDRGRTETEQSEHEYHNDPMTYLIFSFIMSFASISILAGAFALKYGKKRSKLTAVPMILAGVIIWGHWITFNFILVSTYPDDTVFGIIHWVAAPLLKPLMALLGALLGAVLAVFVFLTVIVRS